jgi:NAD(P) transhydrogenase subunit alpha
MNGRWICLLLVAALASIAAPSALAQTKSKPKEPTATKSTTKKSTTSEKQTLPASAKAVKEPRSPSEEVPPPSTAAARSEAPAPPTVAPLSPQQRAEAAERNYRRLLLVSGISIFVLAVFVGFEVISKVPATLHTPLMSGSNAISGITVVGAIIAASTGWGFASFLGFFAVIVAMINVVGGFLVTHRMLLMFKRK